MRRAETDPEGNKQDRVKTRETGEGARALSRGGTRPGSHEAADEPVCTLVMTAEQT